jgi:hypothetical protein
MNQKFQRLLEWQLIPICVNRDPDSKMIISSELRSRWGMKQDSSRISTFQRTKIDLDEDPWKHNSSILSNRESHSSFGYTNFMSFMSFMRFRGF